MTLTEQPRTAWHRVRSGTALLGPAFVAAIAYVEPGNVAANISAGARYGYLLVWVIVLANVMAALVQYLSAKLGLVTGMSLPEALHERMPRGLRLAYWAQAELVAVATDLAEVVGGAIALHLLFGLDLLSGGVITGVVSLVLLTVQNRRGQRPFEHVITGLLLIIAVGFLAGLFVAPPSGTEVLGGLVPRLQGADSLLLAAAMLGATVMPHVVYLHSGLTRDRHGHPPPERRRRLLRTTRLDVGIAMVLAGAVNLGMLLLAATNLQGRTGVDTIAGAHAAIEDTFGSAVALLLAIGLLASGLASTSVGAYSGSMIMQGLLRRRVPLLVRRLVTLVPALVVIALGVNPSWALVVSQVVLSFGIPCALIPLVRLTRDRTLMGCHVNHRATTVISWLIVAVIVALNLVLIAETLTG